MKKVDCRFVKYGICALGAMALCLLAGCAKEKDPMEKIKDLEFTVLAEENIPEELKTVIDEKKEMRLRSLIRTMVFVYLHWVRRAGERRVQYYGK